MEPAAISAKPAVTIRRVWEIAPVRPAARAKGTVKPSDMPITMSRTVLLAVKCFSMCGVIGMDYKQRVATPNENKMSDGGRERASIGVEAWKSSQKRSVQAVCRSLHRMVRCRESTSAAQKPRGQL